VVPQLTPVVLRLQLWDSLEVDGWQEPEAQAYLVTLRDWVPDWPQVPL
jgi:hypothetical protein